MNLQNSEKNTIPKFILSFDFEIAWGDITNNLWRGIEKRGDYIRLREVLPELLNYMDDLSIPAIWATVGAMIENPRERSLEHLPNAAKDIIFDSIETADESSIDGRDLFDNLLAAKTDHVVACHSYSHCPFTYQGMTDDIVSKDIELANRVYSNYDITTDQFVFPENREASYTALKENGYRVARVGSYNTESSRIEYLLGSLYKIPPAILNVEEPDSGVTKHHGSMLFNTGPGRYHRLPFVAARANRGLKNIDSYRTGLHVWTHPYNFSESALQFRLFKSFLRKVADMRDKGKLEIVTEM